VSRPSIDHQEFQQRLDELALILNEQVILREGISTVAAGVGLDVTWVAEVKEPAELAISHVHGGRTDALQQLRIPSGWGATGKAFASGRMHTVNEYFSSTGITHHFDTHIRAEGVQNLIAAPIYQGGQVIGVIAGGHRHQQAFGGVAEDQFAMAAGRASVALSAAARARRLADTAVHEARRDLANSLHDNVGALLFAIQANVRELAQALSVEDGLRDRAHDIEAHVTEAAQALRASLEAMSAPPQGLELEVDLHADCKAFEHRTGLRTSLVLLENMTARPDAARTAALVGAAREALLNVEKHAGASSVVVTLGRRGTSLELTVTDDGEGVTERLAGTPGGLGVAELTRRFARLGGNVQLTSPEDGGAVFRARLPV
jgi:signal transduction histidine kinase